MSNYTCQEPARKFVKRHARRMINHYKAIRANILVMKFHLPRFTVAAMGPKDY